MNTILHHLIVLTCSAVISFIFYLLFCVIELNVVDPIDARITDIYLDRVRSNHFSTLLDINPGDTIIARFSSHRKVEGVNSVTRTLILDTDNESYVLNYIERDIHTGDKSPLLASYRIPSFITGCGYVFSRNRVTINHNVISHFYPIIIDNEKIRFCVKNDLQ